MRVNVTPFAYQMMPPVKKGRSFDWYAVSVVGIDEVHTRKWGEACEEFKRLSQYNYDVRIYGEYFN